jgi:tetratricopeptide (TPR) repeat protein
MPPAPRSQCLPAAAIVALVAAFVACAPRAEDELEKARELQRRGLFAETVAPLRKLVDADPGLVEAHLLLGTALLQTGEAGLAVWPLRRAAESPELAVPAGLLLTRATLEGRSAPDAVAAADRVLALEPENIEALQLRAQAHLGMNREEEALADIARVQELDPQNLFVLIPRVLALLSLERIDEAELALAAAKHELETTEREVPESLQARLCVASALFAFEKSDGDRAAAEALYAACLERYPGDSLAVMETVAFYDRVGDPERGTKTLREALERSPGSSFRAQLAARMTAQGDPGEAERLLRQEAEERPSSAAWFALGDHYVHRERFEPALEAFEKALAADPVPQPMLRFAYADTLVQAGRYERAREVARDLEPEALRDLIEGRVRLEQGDAAGALAAFESGIRLWPNNPVARYLAGQAALRTGDFERAIVQYREALRADAAYTEAGLALARLLAAIGQDTAALDAVRRYVRTHGDDPEGYRLSIRIAHRLGRHGVAAEGLRRLWELPGQQASAAALEASLLAEEQGPTLALEAVSRAGLDLADPTNAAALRVVLAQHAALREHAKAQALVGAALRAHPDAAVFHELHGEVSKAAGEPPEEVRAELERAVALDPGDARALAGLAALAAEAGNGEEALRLYDRAAQADRSDPESDHAAARLLLAAGRTREAEARLAALLDRHPLSGAAAGDLAELLLARGDLDRALAAAQRAALLRSPEAAELLRRVGLARGEVEAPAPRADAKAAAPAAR